MVIVEQNNNNNELKSRSATSSVVNDNKTDKLVDNNHGNDTITTDENKENELTKVKDHTVLNHVLANGLLSTKKGKETFCFVLTIAAIVTLCNAVIVYFSPCYINTKSLC